MTRAIIIGRISILFFACLLVLQGFWPPSLCAQEVIDRIVARVESDVILLSDVRLLTRYQLLVEGKSESDAVILDRLIDQWIVRNEATIARTPQPSDAEIDRGLQRLQQSFASKEDYEARRKLADLSEADVRRLTADQIFLNNYLDSRFRPSVQVDEQAIQDFTRMRCCLAPKVADKIRQPLKRLTITFRRLSYSVASMIRRIAG